MLAPILSKLDRLLRILSLIFLATSVSAVENGFSLTEGQDIEHDVEILPAQGNLLAIWFVDHEEERPSFEKMLQSVNATGVEIWRINLLEDYFLPRSSENARTMPGDGVAVIIKAAHSRSNKKILLVAYDRMPLPLLRGVRQWQTEYRGQSRIAGAILFYPNMFGPSPIAGMDPVPDPILSATNIPVTVYQPMLGSHRWRTVEIMNALWEGGSPAILYLAPNIRDWFFMHPPEQDPAERAATAKVSFNLPKLARLMGSFPKPLAPAAIGENQSPSDQVLGLISIDSSQPAPDLNLKDIFGNRVRLGDAQGRVTLVNFWATWCPPCVDEVPSLNELARRYSGKQFTLISVDFREVEEAILRFVEKVPVDFPVLLDRDGRTSLAWKVFSFPSSFILDRSGKIRYTVNHAIDWNNPEVWGIIDTLLTETY